MLEELAAIHQNVMAALPQTEKRYLFDKINWAARAICVTGARGVGKTTLLCQYLLSQYQNVSQALYISADHICVAGLGLFAIAQEFFKFGGKALFIDEIHKYPDWEREIKNIIDTYRQHQIVFSGSSSVDLHQSKYDLSRRVVYYELKGLSFREYLHFSAQLSFPFFTLDEILHDHVNIADQFKAVTVLKHYRDYLMHGYFPFFLEGVQDYGAKITNIIEKVLFEDIATIYNLRQSTLPILKKLIWLVATSNGLAPNMERISKNIGVSRATVYDCFDYLAHSGLLNNVHVPAKGMKLIRKPEKIYLENTNLLYAIHADLKLENDLGGTRETFFVNQLMQKHALHLHDQGGFVVDGKYVIEVGGKSKDFRQVKSVENAYLAIDNIEIGFGRKVPLYLFGLLY